MRVHGEFPAYEDTELHFRDFAALEALAGRAVKVLDPHLLALPSRFAYQFIWIDRDHHEQAKSHVKFLAAVAGIRPTGAAILRFAASFKRDRNRYLNALRSASRGQIALLQFERILSAPHEAACELEEFVGGPLDKEAMVRQVRPRGPRCRPDLLELELIGGQLR